ncbi:hypothetical protein [Myroides odoratus]|uniref:hypothetical protein n=1 Tax=Myroides odoratus TaxID=256 RepID=UPI00334047E1
MMFRKVKFIVVCAIIALGLSACSSDDGNPVLKLDKKQYNVLIEITEDVEMEQITAYYYDGVQITEEKFIEPAPVVDEDEEGEQGQEPKITQWDRSYTLTVAERVSIEANGVGASTSSKMTITVTGKDGIVLKEKEVKGKDLYLEMNF